MSYGARRLNHRGLRPQIKAKKHTLDKANSAQGEVLQDNSKNETPITITLPGETRVDSRVATPGNNRFHQAMRPTIREYFAPGAGAAGLEGDWIGSQVETRSSASFWGTLLIVLIALVWGASFVIGFQAGLAILLGIGLVLTIFGLVSPSLGLLAVGMVAALDAMANIFLLTGGLLRYNTFNYFLLLIILINIPFLLRLKDLNSRALQFFLLLMAVELIFSTNISNGIQDILNIGATFGMVVYFAKALKDELSFYWLGIVNGVLAGLGGLVFYLQMNKLPYANPNDWTYFNLTALFSICISYPYAIKHHKSRIILLILAVLNFAWIFLSASRGSLLVAILAGAFLFLSTRSITWKTLMIAILLGAGIWFSANFAQQQSTTIARIQQLFDPTLSANQRTSERSAIAEAGWQIFLKNPMGIGTGSFQDASIKTGLVDIQRPAHSSWVQVLAENGVLGILFFTLFVASFAMVGLRKRSEGILLFAVFISLSLAIAFVAKEFRGKSLWFLVASGIVLLRPRLILEYLEQEGLRKSISFSKQIRRVRFGQKR